MEGDGAVERSGKLKVSLEFQGIKLVLAGSWTVGEDLDC